MTRVVEADRRDGLVGYEVDSESGRDVRRDLARAVVTSGWGLLELRPMRVSLEEMFLSLTTDETSLRADGDRRQTHVRRSRQCVTSSRSRTKS